MSTKLKIRFWVASMFLYIWNRWFHRMFSLLSRRLREKQYNDMPEKESWLPQHVLQFFASCKWVSDPLKGKWDYISKPEKFYMTREGDCDDYACFATTMLVRPSQIFSVSWMNPDGSMTGHAVCLYKDNQGAYTHIGNWGMRCPFYSLEQVVASIVPKGSFPMIYSIRDKDLKCQVCHRIKL